MTPIWMFMLNCILTMQLVASSMPNLKEYAKICNITMKPYNAKGDGKTDNTKAIQLAINDCANASSNGDSSLVIVPLYFLNGAETVYMSGALWLQSNIDFYFEDKVRLFGVPCTNASANNKSYPFIYSRYNGIMLMRPSSLINGGICESINYDANAVGDQCKKWKKLKNVKIFGNGWIDGNGHSGWAYPPFQANRPCLLDLLWINNLKIYNVTVTNSPSWTVHPIFCSNVIIDNITISTDGSNTDGIDPDSCQNVLIQNCDISTGDDCIAIKSGKDADGRAVNISSNNITIRNCQFGNGHGITIGSEMSGNITNVLFENLYEDGTQNGPHIKSAQCRGGLIENITYRNIVFKNVGNGITGTEYRDDCGNQTDLWPIIRNISYYNITGSVLKAAGNWNCSKESPCYDINMDHVNITSPVGFSCANIHGQSTDVEPKSCIDPN